MLETISFEQVLSAAVTPLVLISGVGLILLSLVNRYNHAIDRTRQLHNTPLENEGLYQRRQKQVLHMYRRCIILRKSIGYLIISVACSGLIILLSLIQLIIRANLDLFRIGLLFAGVVTLMVSILLFFIDIRLSMTALDIELERKK